MVFVEDQMLEKAVEDVMLIKNVMDRSTESIYLMYRMFIWWGATFTAIGAVCNLLIIFLPGLSNAIYQTPVWAFVPHIAIGIAMFVIFFTFRKGAQDEGLNKQFMVLWLAVLSYSVITALLNVLWLCYFDKDILMHTNLYSYFIPGFSVLGITLAMFCMYLLCHVKAVVLLALVNLIIRLVFSFLPAEYTFRIIGGISYVVTPLTLLSVGILFRMGLQRKVKLTI